MLHGTAKDRLFRKNQTYRHVGADGVAFSDSSLDKGVHFVFPGFRHQKIVDHVGGLLLIRQRAKGLYLSESDEGLHHIFVARRHSVFVGLDV
jgi:hypothetical protein